MGEKIWEREGENRKGEEDEYLLETIHRYCEDKEMGEGSSIHGKQ